MKIDWEKSLKVGGAVIGLVALGYGLYRYEGAASANQSASDQAADEADAELASDFPNEISSGEAGVEDVPTTSESGDNDNSDAVLEALITALLGNNSNSTNTATNPTTTKKTTTTTKKVTTTKKTTTTKTTKHVTNRPATTVKKHTTTTRKIRPTAHPVKHTNPPRK